MYIFFEKSTRGVIYCISDRYGKANNKSLKSYYPKQESKRILICKSFVWLCNVQISSNKWIQMDGS